MFTGLRNVYQGSRFSKAGQFRFHSSVSQNYLRKKIVVILMGENHRCPGPIGLIRQQAQEFFKMGIPQVACVEYPSDLHAEQIEVLVKSTKDENNELLENPSIQELISRHEDLHFSFFPKNALDKIAAIISEQFPYLDKDAKHRLMTHLNTKEMFFFLKEAQVLGIPCHGIDIEEEEHRKLSTYSFKAVKEMESLRIHVMTQNFFKEAFSSISETGGVAWINIGAYHAKNFSASLSHYIIEKELMKKYVIAIIPTIGHSPYIADEETIMESIPFNYPKLNDPKLAAIANQMDISLLYIEEKEKHVYTSREFDVLMRGAKQFMAAPLERGH